MAKSPRPNAPCPCGSGRKYKRCCWLRDRQRPAAPARVQVSAVGLVAGTTRDRRGVYPAVSCYEWRDDTEVVRWVVHHPGRLHAGEEAACRTARAEIERALATGNPAPHALAAHLATRGFVRLRHYRTVVRCEESLPPVPIAEHTPAQLDPGTEVRGAEVRGAEAQQTRRGQAC